MSWRVFGNLVFLPIISETMASQGKARASVRSRRVLHWIISR